MDIQQILAQKIGQLPTGEYTDGLKAVRLHIENAVRHFLRGQKEQDETLFTDAIYRCNQAYEGSVKEAYRVLASQLPEKKTPAQIEAFLTKGNILRPKLLDQLTRYRTEWRNPATHNYMLDFDEDEALLAISSVTTFAIVLCDQIADRLAFKAAAEAAKKIDHTPIVRGNLLNQLARKLVNFGESQHAIDRREATADVYRNLGGALSGFLAANIDTGSDLQIKQEVRLEGSEVDILIESPDERVVIEIKAASSHILPSVFERGLVQLSHIAKAANVTGAILFVYAAHASQYEIQNHSTLSVAARIVAPKNYR